MAPNHRVFFFIWVSVNLLLVCAVAALLYTSLWEYSVRSYLRGFSDAVVPADAPPDQKVEAILSWMTSGPARSASPEGLSQRDPRMTLNYQELLNVCGAGTNAFPPRPAPPGRPGPAAGS